MSAGKTRGDELLKALLASRGCYQNQGDPISHGVEIPEEISAQFDITLDLAYEIHDYLK